MHLHPALASFPVSSLVIALFCAVLGTIPRNPYAKEFSRVAPLLTIFAILSILAAYLTGLPAAEELALTGRVPDDIVARHQSIGKLALFSSLPLLTFSFLRVLKPEQKALHVAFFINILITLALTCLTAFRGGTLVFDYGAGVREAKPQQKMEHEHGSN